MKYIVDYNKGLFTPVFEYPTLRDQFAMAALQGVMSCEDIVDYAGSTEFNRRIAKQVYRIADAMLEARKETK